MHDDRKGGILDGERDEAAKREVGLCAVRIAISNSASVPTHETYLSGNPKSFGWLSSLDCTGRGGISCPSSLSYMSCFGLDGGSICGVWLCVRWKRSVRGEMGEALTEVTLGRTRRQREEEEEEDIRK